MRMAGLAALAAAVVFVAGAASAQVCPMGYVIENGRCVQPGQVYPGATRQPYDQQPRGQSSWGQRQQQYDPQPRGQSFYGGAPPQPAPAPGQSSYGGSGHPLCTVTPNGPEEPCP
jgi:hypothetical protein